MAAAQAKVAPWPAVPTPKPEEVYAGLSDQAKAYPLFLESILRRLGAEHGLVGEDRVKIQARIVRAPMVQEPNSARIVTGV